MRYLTKAERLYEATAVIDLETIRFAKGCLAMQVCMAEQWQAESVCVHPAMIRSHI